MTGRFAATSLLLLLAGCVHVLSVDELIDEGTHRYANVKRERAVTACASALTTLGFGVAEQKPEAGILRSAPKPLAMSVTGEGPYRTDSMTFSVSVENPTPDVAVIRLIPHAFQGGVEIDAIGRWRSKVMDPLFDDFWSHVDVELGPHLGRWWNASQPVSASVPECRMGADGVNACGFNCQMGANGHTYCSSVPSGQCALNSDGTLSCPQMAGAALLVPISPPTCRMGADGVNVCGYNCEMGADGHAYCASVPNGRCAFNANGTRSCP